MKQLLYSPGEPAGIGIDSILQISRQSFWEQINAGIICIADPKLLESRSKILNLKIRSVDGFGLDERARLLTGFEEGCTGFGEKRRRGLRERE